MTVPAEKEASLLSTRFEPLLHRHPTNPILTSKDWPYPINSVFNAGRDAARRMERRCCSAAWKSGAACRISAPRVHATAWMGGRSILSRR